MLSFYIPRRLQHNGMKPVTFRADGTAEPLQSAGEMVQITGTRKSRKGLEVRIRCMCCDFSRPAHATGTEKLLFQGLTHCQRPWLFTDGFCQFVHIDINSQFRIDALFTVVDSQILYQINLLGMRLNGTAIPGYLRCCCSRS